MRRLTYARPAQDDLIGIDRYLSQKADPIVAADQLDRIRRAARRLIEFPCSGPPLPDLPFRTLRVRNTPFVIVYRSRGDAVDILRVFHGARDWPSEMA